MEDVFSKRVKRLRKGFDRVITADMVDVDLSLEDDYWSLLGMPDIGDGILLRSLFTSCHEHQLCKSRVAVAACIQRKLPPERVATRRRERGATIAPLHLGPPRSTWLISSRCRISQLARRGDVEDQRVAAARSCRAQVQGTG